jgi:hypothetical protein
MIRLSLFVSTQDPEAETSLEKSIDVSSESSDASDEKEALELIADGLCTLIVEITYCSCR